MANNTLLERETENCSEHCNCKCCLQKSKRFNNYATVKTLAQGLFDLVLLQTNAKRINYLIQLSRHQQGYELSSTITILHTIYFIVFLQILTGIGIIFLGTSDIVDRDNIERENITIGNKLITLLVFLITVLHSIVEVVYKEKDPRC